MRRSFIYLHFSLLASILQAQIPSWEWVRSAACSDSLAFAEGWSVANDQSGNIFVTGSFGGKNISFDTDTLFNSNTTGANLDIFLAKYDSQGNVLWAQSAGNIDHETSYDVETDLNGNAIITGCFYSAYVVFGNDTLFNSGTVNFFLAKYDSFGNVIWAKSAGGVNQDGGSSVSTDTAGNIFVTGYITSPSILFGSTTLINNGVQDLFVVKYDPNGNILWAKSAGGTNTDISEGISADRSGNAYLVGGFFSNSIMFGTQNLILSGAGSTFLVKYDPLGNVVWARSIASGNNGSNTGYSVSTDFFGNSYLTGIFNSGPVTIGNTTISDVDLNEVYIAKYNSNGNVCWALGGTGQGQDVGFTISVDPSSNVYASGLFYDSLITFGSTVINTPIANCVGGCDPIYILKCDSSGNILCFSSLASGGDDNYGVSADRFGNLYVASDYYADPFVVGPDSVHLTGEEDVYVAKWRCGGLASVFSDRNEPLEVNVHPNPSNGKFTIDVKQKDIIAYNDLRIYDVLGNLVLSCRFNQKAQLDISDQDKGLYFYQLETDQGGFVSGKLVIQ